MDRMTLRLPSPRRRVVVAARAGGAPRARRLAGILTLLVLAGGTAAAQGPTRTRPAPPRPPSFGTESKGADEAPPVLSRGELLRRFDLNFDGKIDAAEGEIGRAKLRREREEEERQRNESAEIDPLTGRPRGEGGLEKEAEPRKRRIISIDDLLPGNDEALQGDEAGATVPGAGRATESRKEKDGAIDPAAAGRSRSGNLFGSKEAPRSSARKPTAAPNGNAARPGMISGGVRAGAPPARPGYGAPSSAAPAGESKSRPLNAGRPAGSSLPGSSTARPGAPAAGGRGGAAAGGTQAPRPQTGRSSATPPTDAAPRVPLFPPRPTE